jgi:ferredoxin
VFDQDADGLVVVTNPVPGPEQEDAAREAATLCPVQAITVHTR